MRLLFKKMRKAERASIVQEILEEYYPETPVPLRS